MRPEIGFIECSQPHKTENAMDDSLNTAEIIELTKGIDPDSDDLYIARRFLSFVRRDGDMPDQSNPHYAGLTQCWRWKWKTKGYPIVYTGKKRGVVAYRVSYGLFKGEIPKGMCVMHRCDNKQCSNPEHLELGTNLQNVRDAHERGLVEKGRMRMKKGVQSVYTMCKFHNLFNSFEESGILNDEPFYTSHPWTYLKKHLHEAFKALVYIHMPDVMNSDLSTRFAMHKYLQSADADAVNELLCQDKSKVAILHPEKDTSSLPVLRYADFVRFEQGETPIHIPLSFYDKKPPVRENYDGTVIEES